MQIYASYRMCPGRSYLRLKIVRETQYLEVSHYVSFDVTNASWCLTAALLD